MKPNQWNTIFDEEINHMRTLVAAHLDGDGDVSDFIVGVQCQDALGQPYWKAISPTDSMWRWAMQFAVLKMAGLSMHQEQPPF